MSHHFYHVAVFSIVLVLSVSAWGGDPVRELTSYTNQEKKFSLRLPRDWERKENLMGSAVVAIGPQGKSSEDFRENINVVVEDLPNAMTSKEYFDVSLKVLKRLFTDFQLEKSGSLKLNQKDAYWVVFTHRMGKVKAKVLQYMLVDGLKAYVITSSSAPQKFSKYQHLFEEVAKSFSLSK